MPYSNLYLYFKDLDISIYCNRRKNSDKFQSNSAEVEQIINLPLEKLMTSISEDSYHLNKNFKMFKFIVDDYIIWGATASILKELIDQLNS